VVRIAVIADIHGNLPALEAADIEQRAVDRAINLGDCRRSTLATGGLRVADGV
jgi:predicted phosphodiesterase